MDDRVWGDQTLKVDFVDVNGKILDANTVEDNGLGWSCLGFRILGLSADSPSLCQRKGPLLFIMVSPPTVVVRLVCSLKETFTKGGWFMELFNAISSVKAIFHPDFQTLHRGRAGSSPELLTRYLFSHSPPVACFFVLLLVFLPSKWQGQRGASAVCNKCCCTEPTGKLYSPRPAITV